MDSHEHCTIIFWEELYQKSRCRLLKLWNIRLSDFIWIVGYKMLFDFEMQKVKLNCLDGFVSMAMLSDVWLTAVTADRT